MREGTIALHTMRRKQLFPTALSNSWTERQAMDGRRNESGKRDDARTAWRDFDRRHYVAFVWRRQRISSNTGLRGPFIGFDMRRCCVSIWLPTHGYALFCWKDDTWIYGKGLVVMYKSFFFFFQYEYTILLEINGSAQNYLGQQLFTANKNSLWKKIRLSLLSWNIDFKIEVFECYIFFFCAFTLFQKILKCFSEK